jgi:hypothetical protein
MRRIEEKAGKGHVQWLDEVILQIGRNKFTRRKLGKLECPAFGAAKILDRNLARFRPRSIKEVAARINLGQFRRKGVGQRTLALWLYLLESVEVDSMAWIKSDLKLSTICSRKASRHRQAA